MEFYQGPIISAPRIIRGDSVVNTRRSTSLAPLPQYQPSHHYPSYTASFSPSSPSSYIYSPPTIQYASPYVGTRRTSVTSSPTSSYIPRSRSSLNYMIADVSKDGGLVTRRLSQSSSSGFQSSNIGPSFRGRSMSIEPTSLGYGIESGLGYGSGYGSGYVNSHVNSYAPPLRSCSSITSYQLPTSRRSSPFYHTIANTTTTSNYPHYQTQPTPITSRITRRDSFSKPYYTLDSDHSSNDLVVKRTSVYQPLTSCNLPLTYLRRSSIHQQEPQPQLPQQPQQIHHATSDGRVVASSNVVSRRTSIGREPSVEASLASRRASVRRSMTPITQQQNYQPQQQQQQLQQRQRTSFYQNVGPPGTESKRSSVVNARTSISSRPGSLANSAGSRRESSAIPVGARISVVSNDGGSQANKSTKMYYDYHSGPQKELSHTYQTARVKNGPVWKENSFDTHGSTRNDRFSLVQQLGSLADLKKRTSQAKDQLGKHRILIDRYLPIKLGPEPDVAFEIQNRYGELVERLPYIERRNRYTDVDGEKDEENNKNTEEEQTKSKIKPYTPASVKSHTSSLFNVHVPNSFTPIVSDTRKRARNVLRKVKGDPNYYNYN